jgi:hypothetical protein
MDEEQVNEEITMKDEELEHLKHITKRVRNQEALTEKTVDYINNKNYLNVADIDLAYKTRVDDTSR